MSLYHVLYSMRLSERHKPTGRTRHFSNDELLATPTELWIAQYSDDVGYYLLYLDTHGAERTG